MINNIIEFKSIKLTKSFICKLSTIYFYQVRNNIFK